VTPEEITNALKTIPDWTYSEEKNSIARSYKMQGFNSAVELINRISGIAEKYNHHPDIHLVGYRNLTVELSTHSAGGLTEKDFLVAAEIEKTEKTSNS